MVKRLENQYSDLLWVSDAEVVTGNFSFSLFYMTSFGFYLLFKPKSLIWLKISKEVFFFLPLLEGIKVIILSQAS
jgi:hypothetical protein